MRFQLEAILDADPPAADEAAEGTTGAAAAKACMDELSRWTKVAEDKEMWVRYNLNQGLQGVALQSLNKVCDFAPWPARGLPVARPWLPRD